MYTIQEYGTVYLIMLKCTGISLGVQEYWRRTVVYYIVQKYCKAYRNMIRICTVYVNVDGDGVQFYTTLYINIGRCTGIWYGYATVYGNISRCTGVWYSVHNKTCKLYRNDKYWYLGTALFIINLEVKVKSESLNGLTNKMVLWSKYLNTLKNRH